MSAIPHLNTTAGQEWYSNPKGTRPAHAIIRDTYKEATQILSLQLNQDECNSIFSNGKCSIDDILELVNESKSRYEMKHTSKARDWLRAFSSRVSHYGVVLDVLVQHHPEYVSLAWGTMKFLFMGVLEHEEKIKQLCKALTEIGGILPATILTLGLYPTPPMMEAVATLYAKIMQFLLKAVQWYKEKPIKHAIGAVLKPWALSYKDIREEIWELSRQVDRLASMAAKAEIRGVHAVVLRAEERAILAEEQARIQIKAVQALPATLVAAQAPQLRQLLQLAIESKSIQQLVLSSQTEFFLENNRNHIISGCFLEVPTSGTSLEYCSSVRDGRKLRPKLRLPEISALERWASNPSLTMVFTKSFSSEAEKDFLVDLVHLIRASGLPVIWTLRYSGYWKAKITCIDILRMLVVQALEINPQALCGPLPITMTSLRQAADQDNWLQILNRALEGIPQVYVVIDAEILGLATEHNRLRATKWIELLPRHISSTRIKLIVSSSNLKESYMSTQWKPESWIRLQTDYHNNRGIGRLRRRNRRTRWARRACP